MARTPIPTWYFAMAVVRLGHRFLLCQERKYGSTWSIPGGRVEPGEQLTDACLREVLEETCVPVHLDGILDCDDGFVVVKAQLDFVAALESANAHG